MAARNIAITDTLETFRTQFNELAANDFGDIGTLDASLTATSVIAAVNEINGVVTAAAGWFITDVDSAIQAVGSGQTLTALGTANQTTAIVTSPDTLTVGLANDVTIPNDLTVTGNITNVGGDITVVGNVSANNITSTGSTQQLGTIVFEGNTISCIDSSTIKVDDALSATSLVGGGVQLIDVGGKATIKKEGVSNVPLYFDCWPVFNQYLSFEGLVNNSKETDIVCEEPTTDNTITIPNASGTFILDTSTAYATSTIFTASSTLSIYNSAGVLQKTIVGSAT
tara:strand:- start:1381 stop:2229 length:849 start_codon:yes stop_codon:yes gene_type:complete